MFADNPDADGHQLQLVSGAQVPERQDVGVEVVNPTLLNVADGDIERLSSGVQRMDLRSEEHTSELQSLR